MTIHLITDTTPACFGVCCPKHAQCARYEAAEGALGASAIATCDDNGDGSRPLFLQLQREEESA